MENIRIYHKNLNVWRMHKTGKIVFVIFRTYLIICLSFVVLYPLLYMISIAFRTTADVVDPSVIWIPKHFTIGNIIETIKISQYWSALKNTALISVGSTLLMLGTCSITGYGLARFPFKGNSLLFTFVILSILVPMQTVAIPMFMQIRFFDFFGIGKIIGLFTGKALEVNLYNTPWALFVPALFGNGIRSGLYIFIFRQYFKGMPLDLEDAAYIDGCGVFKTFGKIIIPLVRSPFLVTFILSIIWYWNDAFLTPFLYNNSQTLAISVDSMLARLCLNYDFTEIFSWQQIYCLLMILPVLIMYLIFQKFFIESIDRTGFK